MTDQADTPDPIGGQSPERQREWSARTSGLRADDTHAAEVRALRAENERLTLDLAEARAATERMYAKWTACFDAARRAEAAARTALAELAAARDREAAVRALLDHARAISPSDRMTVYVGDLDHALGQRDQRARTRTGAEQ